MGEDGAAEDWEVECSDDEKYHPGSDDKGLWEPAAKDILELYEKLSKGESLTLEWKCQHGRRSPTPERTEEEMDVESQKDEEPKEEEKPAPQEFAFDDIEPTTPIALRTPGSAKAPKSTKRVATLNEIMHNMRRHRKLNEEGEKSLKMTPSTKGTTPPATSPGSVSPKTPKTPPVNKPASLSPTSTPQLPGKGNLSPKKL